MLFRDPSGGQCVLRNMEAGDIMATMMRPIYNARITHLLRTGKSALVRHLWAYLAFKLWLGMLRPPRSSDIFDEKQPDYDPQLAK